MGSKSLTGKVFSFFAAVTILTATIVFVIVLMNGTKKETEVVFKEDVIEFKGQYGVAYKLDEITEIRLEDNVPAIGSKRNGAGLGEIKKGDFEVEGLGLCRLFIHTGKGPYIFIKANSKYTIMNFYDPDKTKEVYETLKDKVSSHLIP